MSLSLHGFPIWYVLHLAEVGAYVLNFNGRVTMASVKNFQLVDKRDRTLIDSHIIFPFFRIMRVYITHRAHITCTRALFLPPPHSRDGRSAIRQGRQGPLQHGLSAPHVGAAGVRHLPLVV